MKSIRFESGVDLPPKIQRERMHRIIREELTPLQQQALEDYYFRGLSITAIARARGVHKSTVCRTLHRAEERIKRYLKY